MRIRPSLVFPAAVIFCGGCYNLPEPKVTEEAVFKAAKEVIESRYPNSAPSEVNGFIVAKTPPKMEGGSKTKKQISVLIKRSYTGNYEAVVGVRLLVEGEELPQSNPDTTDLGAAAPIIEDKWRAIDRLPNEEVELSNAILEKISPRGI